MTARGFCGAVTVALLATLAKPAFACSVRQGPPLSRAQVERYARDAHAGPADLLELRMTARVAEGRPGRAIVLRSLKGRFRSGQVLTVTTDDCIGYGPAPAGLVFRAYALRSPMKYMPLDRARQALLIRLGLMPAKWGIVAR